MTAHAREVWEQAQRAADAVEPDLGLSVRIEVRDDAAVQVIAAAEAKADTQQKACDALAIENVRLSDALTAMGRRAVSAEAKADEAERTVRSLATMLGWGNVPPRDTLERDLNALKAKADAARREQRERLEQELYKRVGYFGHGESAHLALKWSDALAALEAAAQGGSRSDGGTCL